MPHEPSSPPMAPASKIGILLINLGTPEDTGYFAVRRYLAEFLSDRRVVPLHPLFWKPILHGAILPRRPFKTGKNYQRIWDDARNGSPLRHFTQKQAELLQARFPQTEIKVTWAMRYGTPSIGEKIDFLCQENCDRIFLFPLYPQYSASTQASALDGVFRHLLQRTNLPAVLSVPPFAGDPDYIDALAKRASAFLSTLSFTPDKILLSFHGIPVKMARKDKRYPKDCLLTAHELRQKMGKSKAEMPLTFQSRFGGGKWLEPYTAETVKTLAQQGVKNIALMAPGFFSDCLETLDELGREMKEIFLENGGENFAVIPCLNDSEEAIDLLEKLLRKAKENFALSSL